ncbi:MAG: MGMT family protein [Flavobacteriaceae bacterium]|nr:MGMT family protein [Flavobacteriaceae bacterium]
MPSGRVTTYGLIAKKIGTALSARTVGWALNACHKDSSIPAHRVVNRNGILTGKHHFKGFELMRQLLENEGIKIDDDKVVDFEKKLWKP